MSRATRLIERLKEAAITPSQLKAEYKKKNPDGHFFDKDTMKTWGDSMSNFKVSDDGGDWKLSRKRRNSRNKDLSDYKFNKETMKYKSIGESGEKDHWDDGEVTNLILAPQDPVPPNWRKKYDKKQAKLKKYSADYDAKKWPNQKGALWPEES